MLRRRLDAERDAARRNLECEKMALKQCIGEEIAQRLHGLAEEEHELKGIPFAD